MSAAPSPTGRKAGRPPCCPRELALRVIQLRRRGLSYKQIANVLNAEQVPTPMGSSRWLKSHVDRLLHTKWVEAVADEQLAPEAGVLAPVTGNQP